MRESKKRPKDSVERSKEKSKEFSCENSKEPKKDKFREISSKNSMKTLNDKSNELSSEMCKKSLKKQSNKRYTRQSTHLEDVELLSNLMSAALEKTSKASDQEFVENDHNGTEEIDGEEDDNSDSEEDVEEKGETNKSSKTRGLTKLLNIFKMKTPMKVNFNEEGQPDSNKSSTLGSFLGLIARNGQVAPLNFVDWRAMPIEYKNMQWHFIQQYFKIPLGGKKWVMKSLGRKWSSFKSQLKKDHYDVYDNDVDRFADRDPRVHPEHWKFLVKHWSSDKGKERCLKNKNSRAQQKITHRSGRKSFARVRKEMKKELKREPRRHELFIRTHTSKNGEPLDEHSKEVIDSIKDIAESYPELVEKETGKDDLFGVVVGEDKHGHVRCFGLGPSPSDVWGEEISRYQALRMLKESQKKENAQKKELSEVKEKMEKLLQRVEYLEKKRKRKHNQKISKGKDVQQNETPSSQSSYEVTTHQEEKPKKVKIRHNRQSEVDVRTRVRLCSARSPHGLIAIGTIVSKDPNRIVGGVALGNEFWEVLIDVPKVLEEPLVRCYKNYKTINDVIGLTIAWPYTFVNEY